MRVAICQPTFLPWIGYFALMDAVDHFVFLDHVQFEKRSWQQRNQIKTAHGALLLTVPVNASRESTIDTVMTAGKTDKLCRSIEHNYKNAHYWDAYGRTVLKILGQNHKYLCSLNLHFLEFFIKVFGIKTRLSCSSQLAARGIKGELLANICKELGATEYVSPPGSKGYLEGYDFPIPVEYFQYDHPEYSQLYGSFLSHMSVIDLLFNEGPNLDIIRRGYVGSDTRAGGIEENTGKEHKGLSRSARSVLYDSSGAEIRTIQ